MEQKAAILLLLNQRLATLIDRMPAAQAGDVQSVHQARVATRRLRGALPVLRTSVDARVLEQIRRQVRRMTRVLGPVRELDVALAHLDELAGRRLVSARAIARVRQAISRERVERRRLMLTAITPEAVDRLRARLGTVTSGPIAPRDDRTIAEADAEVDRRARGLRAAIAHAGALYLPDRLHAVRVAAKKLRYAMEVDRALRRSHVTARIQQLKRLQDLLGEMHDFEMLIARARQLQADLSAREATLGAELATLVAALERDCRERHAVYMRRRDAILRLCALVASTSGRRGARAA
jgi:CHAD domain-containing protein